MAKDVKYTYQNIATAISGLTEFKDILLQESIGQYVSARLNRMHEMEYRINELLMHYEVCDQPVKIKIGSEIEIYNIAGEQSFNSRLRQLAKANDQNDLGALFEARLAKDDSFMPKAAQKLSLNTSFNTGLRHARHVEIDQEPAYNLQIATERNFSHDGKDSSISRIALFQHEIISPPRNLYGLGYWLSTIAQRVIDRSQDFGLNRSEIITTLHDMSTSSLHFHISLIGEKAGKVVNLLQRDIYPNEKGSKKRNPAELSQLAFHTAYAINQFLKDYIYVFAPTTDAYERFSDRHFVGTSFIGFSPRKARFNMGSAMFRGEGRETYRVEDASGTPDKGPLRIELRVPDVSCIGHPNKRIYQDQFMAPFDVTEAIMYMLYRGVESWAKERGAEIQGSPVVLKTEDALYQQRFDLPASKEVAIAELLNAQKRGEGFLTASRAKTMIERGSLHDRINSLDRKPNLPRGQNADRNKYLTP